MGILKDLAVDQAKKFVKTAAVGLAIDVAEKGLDAAGKTVDGVSRIVDATLGDKETRHNRKEQRYLDKAAENILFIKETGVKKEIFDIYNAEGNVKYYVKGKLPKNAKNVRLTLLDAEKQPIASVAKSILALRTPLFHESDPANYRIEISGEEAGTLKTKWSAATEAYEVDPYGWIVKGNFLKWDFSVSDGECQIAHISRRSGYEAPTYIIDFSDEEHELIGLMIVLTLICREH